MGDAQTQPPGFCLFRPTVLFIPFILSILPSCVLRTVTNGPFLP
jgi:hypothetical protein